MKQKLKLVIVEKDVSLILDRSGKEFNDNWTDDNNLLEEFYSRLHDLLDSQETTLGEIDEYVCDVSKAQGLTTARIAQTIMRSFAFANNKSFEFED